jgi:hypothetical protein
VHRALEAFAVAQGYGTFSQMQTALDTTSITRLVKYHFLLKAMPTSDFNSSNFASNQISDVTKTLLSKCVRGCVLLMAQ